MPHRSLFLALVFLASAACGGPQPVVGPAPARLADVAWDATAAPDSIATWAIQGCQTAAGTSRECVERALYRVIEQAGINTAMRALDRVIERDRFVRPEAHGVAHGLGIAAYRSPETVAATFAACTPTQMSGCYHGVVQGYFLDLARRGTGVTAAALDALCEPHRASPFLFFQCAHGIGHGVMAGAGHHLPRALEACDRATDDWVRETCYGGAFMENIVAVSHPHHTAESHAGLGGDDHAGHGAAADSSAGGHGEHAGHAEEWKPLDPEQPLYPCTVVAEKYRFACYTMQSSAVLFMSGGSVEPVAAACEQAPERYRATCFQSLGRDITAVAAQQHGRSRELCEKAGAGEAECIAGVAENLVNLAADVDEGLRFCRGVKGEANTVACYRAVGRMLASLEPTDEGRARRCAAAGPAGVEPCRAGAGLPPRQEG